MGQDVHGVGSTDHRGRALGPGTGGRFSELVVVFVVVMVMSLVVVLVIVAVVFVVSVEESCGVVDDEGRAGACANRGDDGSWHGDAWFVL